MAEGSGAENVLSIFPACLTAPVPEGMGVGGYMGATKGPRVGNPATRESQGNGGKSIRNDNKTIPFTASWEGGECLRASKKARLRSAEF